MGKPRKPRDVRSMKILTIATYKTCGKHIGRSKTTPWAQEKEKKGFTKALENDLLVLRRISVIVLLKA